MNTLSMRRCPVASLLLCGLWPALAGCDATSGPQSPKRVPLADQWLERARVSYRGADFDDAHDASRHALAAAPSDPEIRELAARIALVRLDFSEALRWTEGLTSTSAHAIRGRAYWFSGDLDHAADELEAMLTDPKVKDGWAQEVAGLARRGSGRHPFEMEGSLVAAVEMPRQLDRVSLEAANVVPCELDGERVLALVATGSSEVVLDSNSRREPAWVSLRFDRLEIKDVPAMTSDLAPISRQLGVPVRALLGAQLLRHAHATVDRRGDQFVVRRNDPAPPPEASRVPLYYLRGGGMMLRAGVTSHDDSSLPLLVDSARQFPLMLEDAAWKKAGVDLRTLVAVPDAPNVKRGTVPMFRLGGFDLAKTPAIEGLNLGDVADGIDVDLGGIVGADLLAFFRITFADDGRFIWMEADPTIVSGGDGAGASPSVAPPPQAVPSPPAAPASPPASTTAPPTSQRDR